VGINAGLTVYIQDIGGNSRMPSTCYFTHGSITDYDIAVYDRCIDKIIVNIY